LPLELIIFCGAVPAPPRKAKLQNKSQSPNKLAVWKRLLSVWKRMETFGNESKGIAGNANLNDIYIDVLPG